MRKTRPSPRATVCALLFASVVLAVPASAAPEGGPSRPPVKGCVWEKKTDATLGLDAWVQRCDFGFRKIDFRVAQHSLSITIPTVVLRNLSST